MAEHLDLLTIGRRIAHQKLQILGRDGRTLQNRRHTANDKGLKPVCSKAASTSSTKASSEDADTGTNLAQEETPPGTEGAQQAGQDQIEIARSMSGRSGCRRRLVAVNSSTVTRGLVSA